MTNCHQHIAKLRMTDKLRTGFFVSNNQKINNKKSQDNITIFHQLL